jgi:PBSX family phage portal protein
MSKKELRAKVTLIKNADSDLLVTTAALPEDGFAGQYWDGNTGTYLMPPYSFSALEKIFEENNALGPCVEAYVTNIAGTGYSLEKGGVPVPRKDTDTKAQGLFGYFDEISPGSSLTKLRKAACRTTEITGNAFLEVVRNAYGDIVFLNLLPTNMMRLVKLGELTTVTKTMNRFGNNLDVSMQVRERLYVQLVNNTYTYFREFGSSRDVHRETGEWFNAGTLSTSERGNEIIHYTAIKAANSPYGVPRWINQSPSAIGSRRAEEANLDFFAAGGIPRVVFVVTGGVIHTEVRTQLETMFSNTVKGGVRCAVLEVQSSGGSLDKEGAVKVDVERFGSEEQNDSMFENYDEKCELRIRRAFRLPPLFVGMAQDYNYASAYASYLVAEAQIFRPERDEFDEVFNATIMRELDPSKEYTYRSKAISITDAVTKIRGLTLLKGLPGIDPVSWVSSVNDVTSVDVTFDEGTAEEDSAFKRELLLKPFNPDQAQVNATKGDKTSWLQVLADNFSVATGVSHGEMSHEESLATVAAVASLTKLEKGTFDTLFAGKLFPDTSQDEAGSVEICSCLVDHIGGHHA